MQKSSQVPLEGKELELEMAARRQKREAEAERRREEEERSRRQKEQVEMYDYEGEDSEMVSTLASIWKSADLYRVRLPPGSLPHLTPYLGPG